MKSNLKKGLSFGIFGVFAESILPIVIKLKPNEVDSIFYAWTTLIVESFILIPIILIEINSNKKKKQDFPENLHISNPSLSNRRIIFYNLATGLIFSIALILHYWGLTFTDAILSSIVLKSSILYSMLIGWIFLKENVSWQQAIFTLVLLFGVIFSISRGFSVQIDFNSGGLILLGVPLLWMAGHVFTKRLMKHEVGSPYQIVFWRTLCGSIFIGVYYILFYPINNFILYFEPGYLLSFLFGGLCYTCIHICWYKVLQYIDLAKSTAIYGLTPIVTSVFAIFLLNEELSWYYLVGIVLVVGSIYFIYREKKIHQEKDNIGKKD